MIVLENFSEHTPSRIEVVGDVAYMVGSGPDFEVLDVSDPTSPVEVGTIPLPEYGRDFVVAGGLAYVAAYDSGLRILDVTDPSQMAELSALVTPGRAFAVDAVADLAFVAAQTEGLRVVDVSDPSAPVEISGVTFGYGSWTMDVEVAGDYAYCANFTHGLAVVDITDPRQPVVVGEFDTPGWARHLSVVGSVVYVADSQAGLVAIDVSDPTHPVEFSSGPTPFRAEAFHIAGNRAYVSHGLGGFRIIDISDPAAIAHVNQFDVGRALTIHVVDEIAYASVELHGLTIIDVSHPEFPAVTAELDTPYDAYAVETEEGLAYVADIHGIRIIDTTDPRAPFEISQYGEGSIVVYDLVLVGHLLYAAGFPRLVILDVSDPSAPFEVGRFEDPQDIPRDLEVIGDLAFMALNTRGYSILDVSDPSAPFEVVRRDTPGRTWDVEVWNGYLFQADDWRGLRIDDISVPSAPINVEYGLGRDLRYVEFWDDLLFVFGRVYDPSDPEALVPLGDPVGCSPIEDDREGNRVYSRCNGGVLVTDFSTVLEPRVLGGVSGSWLPNDLSISDGLVTVANRADGIAIVDFGPEYLAPIDAAVDVRPWSPWDRVNPSSNLPLPVALLGSRELSVGDVDASSLRFGPLGAPAAETLTAILRDTNFDGRDDLLLHFVPKKSGLVLGDTEACLEGQLANGRKVGGCDTIVTDDRVCGLGFELVWILAPLFWLRGRRRDRLRQNRY